MKTCNSIFVETRELVKMDPIGKTQQRSHIFGVYRHSTYDIIILVLVKHVRHQRILHAGIEPEGKVTRNKSTAMGISYII